LEDQRTIQFACDVANVASLGPVWEAEQGMAALAHW
jgi:hypothetical protein